MGASAKQKAIFWIIAGVISVFFAEVVSGSTPFPFFTLEGWLIIFPVYELHIVLITSEILLTGRSEIIANFPEHLKKMVAYKIKEESCSCSSLLLSLSLFISGKEDFALCDIPLRTTR